MNKFKLIVYKVSLPGLDLQHHLHKELCKFYHSLCICEQGQFQLLEEPWKCFKNNHHHGNFKPYFEIQFEMRNLKASHTLTPTNSIAYVLYFMLCCALAWGTCTGRVMGCVTCFKVSLVIILSGWNRNLRLQKWQLNIVGTTSITNQ